MGYLLAFIAVVGLFFCMPLWLGAFFRLVRGILQVLWSPVAATRRALWGEHGNPLRVRRRQSSYKVLGEFLPRLVAAGADERVYRAMAESMPPQRLREMLEKHLVEIEREKVREALRQEMIEGEAAVGLAALSAAHREMIAEAEVEKERLRTQAEMMAGVVDRLKDRYLPEDAPDGGAPHAEDAR